jgi:hypothetical protein
MALLKRAHAPAHKHTLKWRLNVCKFCTHNILSYWNWIETVTVKRRILMTCDIPVDLNLQKHLKSRNTHLLRTWQLHRWPIPELRYYRTGNCPSSLQNICKMIQEPTTTSFTNWVPFVRFWKVQTYLSKQSTDMRQQTYSFTHSYSQHAPAA